MAVVAVVLGGSGLGVTTMLAVDDASTDESRFGARETPPTAEPTVATDPVLLVWTPDGLPVALAAAVGELDAVTALTEVRGDLVEMIDPASPAGFVVPLDALSVDPASYASFLPKGPAATVATLAPGEGILGTTSARLRRADVGDEILLAAGQKIRIAAVLDDTLVGAAELVVAHGTVPSIDTPRFLLLEYRGPREGVEQAIRELLPAATPVRFRAPGETPLLRHGDGVLPQATIKEQFGEFAYRRTSGRDLELDPAWVREHIVEVELPLLGRVRCHRAIVDDLRAALVELEQRNLGYLVMNDGFRGCFVPRLIALDGGVSRHSWGISLDINYGKNREGELGTQDSRLVDVMTARGFTWGGPWLDPDPAHFEWVSTRGAQAGQP